MNDAITISPYLTKPIRTLDEALAAIDSHSVSAADRRKLALLALSTASRAAAEGDVASALMFTADAQLHLKAMGAVVAGTRIVEGTCPASDRLAGEGLPPAKCSAEALYLAAQIIHAAGGNARRTAEAAVMLDTFAAKGMINPDREQRIRELVEAARAYRDAETDGTPRMWRGKDLQDLANALDAALALFAEDRK